MLPTPAAELSEAEQWLRFILISLNQVENDFMQLGKKQDKAQQANALPSANASLPNLVLPQTKDPDGNQVEYWNGYRITEEDDSDSSYDSESDSEASSRASTPTVRVTRSRSDSILDAQRDSSEDDNLIFRKPATQEEIQQIEAILDMQLPKDYKQLLLLTNGLEPFPSRSDPGLRAVHGRRNSNMDMHQLKAGTKDEYFGLHWQKSHLLELDCPARSWFPKPRTMIKISNWDEESYVWLVTPQGMVDAQLQDYCRRRASLSAIGEADDGAQSWGVLRWTRTQQSREGHITHPIILGDLDCETTDGQSSNMIDREIADRSKDLDENVAIIYNSVTDYLEVLLKSLETAYQYEVAELDSIAS